MGVWRLLIAVLWVARASSQDLPTCVESFDIRQDKIIRTQDSRSMGAKYLNERDVPSREECLRLCCETAECDVIVFEQKVPGSCYLFQCGTPEDFKCKFTKHRNYTSGVLVLGRHLTELESQIKHTQAEHELAKLRQPESEAVSTTIPEVTTRIARGNKEVAPVLPTVVAQLIPSHPCSRYQFECHGSGECIAIYNACDGIPQCSDGSDEAPELGCPAQVVQTVPPPRVVSTSGQQSDQQSIIGHPDYRSNSHNVLARTEGSLPAPALTKPFVQTQWSPQIFDTQRVRSSINGYLQQGDQQNLQTIHQPPQTATDLSHSPVQLVNQVKQYGREGEGLHAPEMVQWSSPYQQEPLLGYRPPNSGGSQIFTHKGSGLMAQSDSMTGKYDPLQPDYSRYNYYDNIPYHKAPSGNNWQPFHKPHADLTVEETMNMMSNIPQNNLPGQDYYYEENFRTRLQPQLIPQRLSGQAHLPIPPKAAKVNPLPKGEAEVETQEAVVEAEEKATTTNTSIKKSPPSTAVTVAHPTDKPKSSRMHHHNSHRKVDTLSAEISLTENSFDSDSDGQNVNPHGAILSLTLGLCVTGIMIVLVGCRMKMVRRRIRRGSKSPYAHDADFLVNGMYL